MKELTQEERIEMYKQLVNGNYITQNMLRYKIGVYAKRFFYLSLLFGLLSIGFIFLLFKTYNL